MWLSVNTIELFYSSCIILIFLVLFNLFSCFLYCILLLFQSVLMSQAMMNDVLSWLRMATVLASQHGWMHCVGEHVGGVIGLDDNGYLIISVNILFYYEFPTIWVRKETAAVPADANYLRNCKQCKNCAY